jgi:hypothetical protein
MEKRDKRLRERERKGMKEQAKGEKWEYKYFKKQVRKLLYVI